MGLLQSLMLSVDVRTVLLCVSVLLVLFWLLRKPKNLPPGPREVPVIGSVPSLVWEAVRRGSDPYRIFGRYAKTYGPVVHLKLFYRSVIVLNDYASVKEAFQNPKLNDRPKITLGEILQSEGVAKASGELWTELRRFCLTVLRSFGVGKSSFEEKIGTEAEELMKEMVNFDGKPFNPKPLLTKAVSNVICDVLFGERYEYSDRKFDELPVLVLLSRSAELLGPSSFLKMNLIPSRIWHLPLAGFKEILYNFNNLRKFMQNIVDVHRDTFDANNLRDFTDAYLMEVKETPEQDETGPQTAKRRHLSEGNLVGTMANLFVGGMETTATTLQWCILYMMIYPDIQKRVQAEIDAVVGRNRLPRLADKPELNFTQAVIWEVQRLGSVAPLGVPHAAASDTKLQGFEVPKGAMIVPNLWHIFRDPKVWPEPEQFKPERFLTDDGKAVKPQELIPFSTGRRSCIGEHLTKMELYVYFSYFMHQFTFKKSDNSPPPSLKGLLGGLFIYAPLPFDTCAVKRN